MKRKIKRTRIRYDRIAITMLFFVSLFGVLIINPIVLTSFQTQTSVQIQRYERMIAQVERENEALLIDIQQLSQYTRIVAIAREGGYERSHTNIITIGSQE